MLNSINHSLTWQESTFTATGEKIQHHWPIFKKYKETGYGSIIRATMTNHQVCASRCRYCSTINRNKKDSVSLEEAKDFVRKLYYDQAEFNKKQFAQYNQEYVDVTGSDIRLRGLILSGGGQPNLWPHFEEFVNWLSDLDIDLGLITNGFPKKVNKDIYKHFSWVRLSITPEEASAFYPQGRFDLQYVPENLINGSTTFGLSYVYGPWADQSMLTRIEKAAQHWNVEYARVLADCNLPREQQLAAHQQLANDLYAVGLIDVNGRPLGKVFHQLKYHGTQEESNALWDQGQCFLQSFNVFWDTTDHETNNFSYCYPCDSVTVLADEQTDSERKFNYKRWGTVKNTEVERLWTKPVHPFFDPRKQCSSCLFIKNNQTVKQLVNTSDYKTVVVNQNLTHINFP